MASLLFIMFLLLKIQKRFQLFNVKILLKIIQNKEIYFLFLSGIVITSISVIIRKMFIESSKFQLVFTNFADYF